MIVRATSTSAARLTREFDRQLESLLSKGYAQLAGLDVSEFTQVVAPLRDIVPHLGGSLSETAIPFVIVVKNELVSSESAMPLVALSDQHGFVRMDPVHPADFTPIEGIELPPGPAYLVTDIDTGRRTLNVTPDDALATIAGEHRSPLTIDEGIAVITHYPEVLETMNCFSTLGSRRGDKRVPALWVSGGRPRLGWCWGGNPHTWLGSASCAIRIGS